MSGSAPIADRKWAIGLDVAGALAISSRRLMSVLGPVPFWAQVACPGGAMADGGSALSLRNDVSLACLGLVIVCAIYQVVCAA